MDLGALCRAIRAKDGQATLEVLAAAPPDPADHGRALVLAAHMGDAALVRHLLVSEDSEVDLGARYMDRTRPGYKCSVGRAALNKAAAGGHGAVVEELLSDGRVDPLAEGRLRPLMLANYHGHDAVVHRLLEVPAVHDAARAATLRSLRRWRTFSGRHTPALQEYIDAADKLDAVQVPTDE